MKNMKDYESANCPPGELTSCDDHAVAEMDWAPRSPGTEFKTKRGTLWATSWR